MRTTQLICVLTFVVGCGANNDTANSNTATNNAATNNAATNNAATNNAATNNATTNNAATNNAATNNAATNNAATNNTTGTNTAVMTACHDLSYEITCNVPQMANGYFACSDYFGDVTGVEVSCSANPLVDVGSDPCGSYEFAVGSCVYYTDALPNRCYVTHVGSVTADGVAAGQQFWEVNCAGEWIPAN